MDLALARQIEICNSLSEILAVLNSDRPLPEILDYIITRAAETLRAEAAFIYTVPENPVAGSSILEAAYGLPSELVAVGTVPYIRGMTNDVSRALRSRAAFAVPDLSGHLAAAVAEDRVVATPAERIWTEMTPRLFRSALAVPLATRSGIWGGLTFYFADRQTFEEEDLKVATALGDQVALAVENARLRAQAEQLAVVAERNRLARELHDAVTQTLFSATLIADVLPRLWQRDPNSIPARLEQLRRLTRGALAEMRTLLLELRPASLTGAALGELLRQLCDAATGQSAIPVTLTVEGEPNLPPDTQVAFYRIAQEALNNVVKHSGAEHASVALQCRPDFVALTIRDDGRGFDPALVPSNHLGLSIMRERAKSAGATAALKSAPGEGTEVTIRWSPGPVA